MSTVPVSETSTPDPGLPRPEPRVGEHLRQLAAGESIDADAIRETVCGYVRALRAVGARPEQMIVAVKAELANSGLYAARNQAAPVSAEQIVRWCITEYYRAA